MKRCSIFCLKQSRHRVGYENDQGHLKMQYCGYLWNTAKPWMLSCITKALLIFGTFISLTVCKAFAFKIANTFVYLNILHKVGLSNNHCHKSANNYI